MVVPFVATSLVLNLFNAAHPVASLASNSLYEYNCRWSECETLDSFAVPLKPSLLLWSVLMLMLNIVAVALEMQTTGNESSKTTTSFTAKQNPKKKRKSRTAFTNSQIYELERRFRLQKYLSPTDRDEIAMTLNLSNAQVITWFQNRRAKMKRDLEEQRRDIETASLLNIQKTFLESLMALSTMNTPPNMKKE